MEIQKVFLSLGSNKGSRHEYLQFAHQSIIKNIGIIEKYSSIYESVPWGFFSTNLFLNQVLEIKFSGDPFQLLNLIQKIELEAGRVRNDSYYTDRTLDIDILFFGQEIINHPKLVIPHKHITQRRFVLEPLCEIASDFIHPVFLQPISFILSNCTDSPICKLKL